MTHIAIQEKKDGKVAIGWNTSVTSSISDEQYKS
jgi:hypothetical protein